MTAPVYDVRVATVARRFGAALRWRPEWWVASVVAVAWVALLATGLSTHDNHQGRPMPGSDGLLTALPGWTLMSVAMMVPVTLPAVRHVGLNSIRQRRQWAMALYVVVYGGVWAAFGGLVLTGAYLAREILGLDGRVLLVFALGVAAGWQLTRVKRRALLRCRRTVPLPPVGRRADAACVRFALQQGWRCVVSCWALMAVMAVVSHSALIWMAALTALIVAEELTLVGRRLLQPSAVALTAAAGLVAFGI